jgi:hypothetical protein
MQALHFSSAQQTSGGGWYYRQFMMGHGVECKDENRVVVLELMCKGFEL